MMRTSLRVLAYHRIIEPSRHINPSLISAVPAVFERQIEQLVTRYHVVSLPEVLDAQRGGTPLPKRAVLLTFDDAYSDFAEVAWPILHAHGLPAVVFVPTAFPGDRARAFWWDRLHYAFEHSGCRTLDAPTLGTLPLHNAATRRNSQLAVQQLVKRLPHHEAMLLVERLCRALEVDAPRRSSVLSWQELRRLHDAGVSLAAHTRTHPALTQLTPAAVSAEIRGSFDDLRREIGAILPVFCSPFGLFDDRALEEMKRHGVELAFTCLDGHNRLPTSDPLRIRRTDITRRTTPHVLRLRLWKAVSYVDMWRHRTRHRAVSATAAVDTHQPGGGSIAYIMSRFPKLSETFVLNEILTLESLGVSVDVYPLLRERQPVAHPEAARVTARAHFHPFVSLAIVRAQLHFLRRQPRVYLRVLFEVLRKTWGSANFFIGAIGLFPKSVRFAYEMQRSGVMHIHAHFCTHPAVAALVIHRLTGIPFSFTAHGSDLHVERRMLDTKVAAAAFAVTVCDFNREVMVRACGEQSRNHVHVIHCGVDTSYFSPAAGRAAKAPLHIVCVGSLEEVKGHRFLIDACRMLEESGIDFRCDLIGAGPQHDVLQARIDANRLGERVRLLGGQPREVVARTLAAADVAVLASHPTRAGKREGLPVALMEAMAAGLPVVASDLSGIPELVEHEVTGLLVPPGDTVAIAQALQRLAADRQLRLRLGSAGRNKVAREFSLEENVRLLLRLFLQQSANETAYGFVSAQLPLRRSGVLT